MADAVFTLKDSLKDEEIVRIRVTTFSGETKEFVTTAAMLRTGNSEAFAAYISKEQGIGYKMVQGFCVETLDGIGGEFIRNSNTVDFMPKKRVIQ